MRAEPYLVVVAHPDDETLAAGALLGRLRPVSILHVTDGAPRDPRFVPRGIELSRSAYAALRREEAVAALELASIGAERIARLDVVDQEATSRLPFLVERLCEHMMYVAPSHIVTQPYEGGHPDHDAVAFAVHTAIALLRRAGRCAPKILEAASYHGAGGRFTPGEFLPADGREVCIELDDDDVARKRAMLACYASQRDVIAAFPVREERVRVAPRYDFTRAPHAGPLHYERLAWPTSGAEFRRRARECLRALDLEGISCL